MQRTTMAVMEMVEYFETKYFVDRDIEAALECLTEDVRWLGAADAEDNLLVGKEQVREMYLRTIGILPTRLEVKHNLLDIMELGNGSVMLFVRNDVLDAETGQTIYRQRAEYICRKERETYKICSLHGSVYFDAQKQRMAIYKMKSSEAELNNIVNALPGGFVVYRLSPSGSLSVDYFSAGVAELVGYSWEEMKELLEEDSFALIYSDDREAMHEAVIGGITTGERRDITFRCKDKKDDTVWASMVVQSAGRQGEDYIGHAVLTDTPKQYDLFKSIMDETETCIYVVDAETFEIYYANNAMKRMLNFEGKDYLGKKCYEMLFDRNKPCNRCSICTGIEINNEERFLPDFGNKTALVRDRLTSWMGRPSMIRYAKDITDSKAAEESLKKEQDRYRFIVENTGTVIFDWDMVSKTTYTSGDYERYLVSCCPLDDIVKSRVPAYAIHPDDLHLLQKFGQEADSGKPFAETTLRAHMRDGSYRWTTVSVNNICDDEGRRIRVIGTIRDVNDAQAAVYDRQLSLMRVNTIIEDADIYYWEVDFKTQRAIMGSNTQSAMGVGPVFENYPESFFEEGIFIKGYEEQFRQLHRKIENGAEYAETRLPIRKPGVGEVWHRVRYHTLFDSSGHPVRAIGTALDITEQVNAERKYKDIVAMQDALAQHAYKFYLFNLTKNRVESAQSSEARTRAYLGMSYDDYLLESGEYITEESREMFLRNFDRKRLLSLFEAGTTSINALVRNITEQQQEISLEINMSLTRNPVSGDVVAFSYGLDVTRQKMEQEVIEAVSTYDFDLIALVDLDADKVTMFKKQEDCFVHLNNVGPLNFTKTIRLSAEAYVVPEDREQFLHNSSIEVIRRELKTKSCFEFTFRFFGENGSIRIKKSRYADYKMSGGMVLLTRIDVTDVVSAQEKHNSALQAALDSARQANAAKTVFLSSMSHDIRTPLNAIIGMTELALSDNSSRQQVTESLATIKEASDHLLSIINSILEMSRIESGKVVTAEETFSHSEVLDKLSQISAPMLKSKAQTLSITTDIFHNKCTGDALRLSRVLENIVSNAIKFTPAGGSISLVCKELPADSDSDIVCFCYTVTDTGIGMSEEQLEHIFEPFYRIGTTSTTGIEGSGLGLAIVKSTLELMGGSIEVKSRLGEGSSFVIEVPFRVTHKQREPQEAQPQPAAKTVDFSGKTILLVEDHPINAIVATRMLEKGGASVSMAANGLEGYERFKQSERDEFDAILMDIQMPVMNGYEAAWAIRECDHPRAKTIPIIAMTADAFADDVKKPGTAE